MLATPHEQRARVAATVRHHGADAPQVADLRRDLAAAKIAAYIEKVVAAAPPLTTAQVDELSLLFRGSADG